MIGSPVGHVRSPALLNALFQEAGDDAEVVTEEVDEHRLEARVAGYRRDPRLIGLIVTTPLKQAICRYVVRRTELVDLLGAANCIRCDEGRWIAANFDGHGLIGALGEAGIGVAGQSVLIVGCGGAGSAIAVSFARAGAAPLTLHDVDAARACALAARLGGEAAAAHARAGSPAGAFGIVVNASHVGMRRGDPSPVPREVVEAADVVVDIVIAPEDSRLKRDALAAGKIFVDGYAMVAGQARALRRFLLSDARSEGDAVRVNRAVSDRS